MVRANVLCMIAVTCLVAQGKTVPIFIENPQASAPGDNQVSGIFW